MNRDDICSFDGQDKLVGTKTVGTRLIGGSIGEETIASESTPLFISPNWQLSDGDIIITGTITDLGVPGQNTVGNCQDQPVSFTWIIKFDEDCPPGLSLVNPLPNNSWKNGNPFVEYTYQVTPSAAPFTYFNSTIIEEFGRILALFSLNDVKDEFF